MNIRTEQGFWEGEEALLIPLPIMSLREHSSIPNYVFATVYDYDGEDIEVYIDSTCGGREKVPYQPFRQKCHTKTVSLDILIEMVKEFGIVRFMNEKSEATYFNYVIADRELLKDFYNRIPEKYRKWCIFETYKEIDEERFGDMVYRDKELLGSFSEDMYRTNLSAAPYPIMYSYFSEQLSELPEELFNYIIESMESYTGDKVHVISERVVSRGEVYFWNEKIFTNDKNVCLDILALYGIRDCIIGHEYSINHYDFDMLEMFSLLKMGA